MTQNLARPLFGLYYAFSGKNEMDLQFANVVHRKEIASYDENILSLAQEILRVCLSETKGLLSDQVLDEISKECQIGKQLILGKDTDLSIFETMNLASSLCSRLQTTPKEWTELTARVEAFISSAKKDIVRWTATGYFVDRSIIRLLTTEELPSDHIIAKVLSRIGIFAGKLPRVLAASEMKEACVKIKAFLARQPSADVWIRENAHAIHHRMRDVLFSIERKPTMIFHEHNISFFLEALLMDIRVN